MKKVKTKKAQNESIECKCRECIEKRFSEKLMKSVVSNICGVCRSGKGTSTCKKCLIFSDLAKMIATMQVRAILIYNAKLGAEETARELGMKEEAIGTTASSSEFLEMLRKLSHGDNSALLEYDRKYLLVKAKQKKGER